MTTEGVLKISASLILPRCWRMLWLAFGADVATRVLTTTIGDGNVAGNGMSRKGGYYRR